jgi:hypothetical protein
MAVLHSNGQHRNSMAIKLKFRPPVPPDPPTNSDVSSPVPDVKQLKVKRIKCKPLKDKPLKVLYLYFLYGSCETVVQEGSEEDDPLPKWDLLQTYTSAELANQGAWRWMEKMHKRLGIPEGIPCEDLEYREETGGRCVKLADVPSMVGELGIKLTAWTKESRLK